MKLTSIHLEHGYTHDKYHERRYELKDTCEWCKVLQRSCLTFRRLTFPNFLRLFPEVGGFCKPDGNESDDMLVENRVGVNECGVRSTNRQCD